MGHHPCCAPCWGPAMIVWTPVAWPQTLVREIEVDSATPSREALLGGASPAVLTLEYLVAEGAASPSVAVNVTAGTQSQDWQAAAPAPGYATLQPLGAIAPGAKVTLKANNVLARLRWCETVCC